MDALQVTRLVFVAAGATVVVRTRDRVRLVLVLSVYGMLLAILFFAFQAPDVTLSELTVGAVALPLLLLLALAKVRDRPKCHRGCAAGCSWAGAPSSPWCTCTGCTGCLASAGIRVRTGTLLIRSRWARPTRRGSCRR